VPLDGDLPLSLPVHADGLSAPPAQGDVAPLPPACSKSPLHNGLAPLHLAPDDASVNKVRRMTTAPSSRLRCATARVGDVETSAEAQARRRSKGTVGMQGICGFLNPRVSKLVPLAIVSGDISLYPENKLDVIVVNAMELWASARKRPTFSCWR